ncbi:MULTISPECIES: thiamine-phosphate kinase [unclassified Thioalkalivibrio]|uniref:thiamine-phosphate kinase n=1 Tax=unclassified Thioalkalivibrio TaxID=2621013 RepID=UPI000195A4F3|nr:MULTISPECIES: thiamine-phosphate kinase [unclassified Thioalkalivibrio]ADC72174.1 thiamine-monophosphate kinase [Thioalkalivibrio sp. K90mix]
MTGPDSEFDLIRRYFAEPAGTSPDVRLGIGDDAALLGVQAGHELVVSVDTMVEGTHYFPDHPPASLGHKALAANLSDLAAMGADPLGAVLSLTLPSVDHDWLAAFSRGFLALAEQASVPLVGGDTTRGPGAISVTVLGQVPAGQALRRAGARPGDRLVVSGALGGAAAGLAFEKQRRAQGRPPDEESPDCARLFWPSARLALGRGLRNRARAVIDISDGLLADLGHLAAACGCGARVDWSQLPVDPLLEGQPEEMVRDCVLAGGEDYELLFALPPTEPLELLSLSVRTSLTVIGEFTSGSDIEVVDAHGARLDVARRGHDHFAG